MKTPSKRSGPSSPRASANSSKGSSALPKAGEVINYSYLWEYEFRQGRDEGVKERPLAVVLVTQSVDGLDQVHVVPMTTQPPRKGQKSIEVPSAVRVHLGLSAERSWVVVDEWNRFTWPGYDIRPIRGREPAISYGFIPAGFFRQLRDALVAAAIGRPVSRDD